MRSHGRGVAGFLWALGGAFGVCPVTTLADGDAPPGSVSCAISENGTQASGTMSLRRDGTEIARGACGGAAITAPSGSYQAVLRLDGALDRPEQTRAVSVRAGATAVVSADFATALLEVQITAGGRRAAGMATIYRGGASIGQVGGGVTAHLSTGMYDVVVRYRASERRFDAVTLVSGQRTALSAEF